MKRVTKFSNKVILTSSAISVAALVATPLSTFAIARANGGAAGAKTSPFCNNLSTTTNGITTKISDLQGKVSQAWSTQDQKLASDAQSVDQKVAAARQKADSERSADFTKLEAKATTGTQKQAVQDYETAVNNAVATRRAAYDAARQTFRDGVKSAVDSRRSTVSGQASTFEDSVNSAIATAQASCSSDPGAGAAARTAFVSSLKTARQTFNGSRKDDTKIGQQVSQLAATRNAAFKAADQAFQNSLKTARQALVQAFGKKSI